MFIKRCLTALVTIPFIVMTIHYGYFPFFILVSGIAIVGIIEFYELSEKMGFHPRKSFGISAGFILLITIFINDANIASIFSNNATSFFLTFCIILIFSYEVIKSDLSRAMPTVAITLLGIFYIAWLIGHLLLIRRINPDGSIYIYLLFSIVWLMDSISYFFGTRYGRRKLAFSISPNKTVEGGVAGLITAILTVFIFKLFFLRNLTFFNSILIGLFVGIAGQFGDLSESLLKRSSGVKDSSELIPGHGGVLDKIDSFLFSAPILYYYLKLTVITVYFVFCIFYASRNHAHICR